MSVAANKRTGGIAFSPSYTPVRRKRLVHHILDSELQHSILDGEMDFRLFVNDVSQVVSALLGGLYQGERSHASRTQEHSVVDRRGRRQEDAPG